MTYIIAQLQSLFDTMLRFLSRKEAESKQGIEKDRKELRAHEISSEALKKEINRKEMDEAVMIEQREKIFTLKENLNAILGQIESLQMEGTFIAEIGGKGRIRGFGRTGSVSSAMLFKDDLYENGRYLIRLTLFQSFIFAVGFLCMGGGIAFLIFEAVNRLS